MNLRTLLEALEASAPQVTNDRISTTTHPWHGPVVEFNGIFAPGVIARIEKNANLNKGKRNVNPEHIRYFCGDELFLSNFYLTPIRWEGLTYPSVEHALQASMCFEPKDRLFFTIGSVKDARRLGQQIKRHYFWRDILRSVIDELLEIKFRNPILRQQLLDTGERVIAVGNNWGHDYRDLNLSDSLMYLRECLSTGYNPRHDL